MPKYVTKYDIHFDMRSVCHKWCFLLTEILPVPLVASWEALFQEAKGPCWVASGPWAAFPLEGSEVGFLVVPSLENTNIFQTWVIWTKHSSHTERWLYRNGFPTPTYKRWGDSWRWNTRKRWCLTGATISISRGLLWTRESITVTKSLVRMLNIADLILMSI